MRRTIVINFRFVFILELCHLHHHPIVTCEYGDSIFFKAITNIGYRIQVLHHAMVMNAEKVLFITAQRNGIIFMLLIDIPAEIRTIYKNLLLKFICEKLEWTYSIDGKFPAGQVSEDGLGGRGYHFDVHSIRLNFSLWKRIRLMVEKKGKPFPRCRQIVPRAVAFWNKNKVYTMSQTVT